jgi:hypothetical protein
VAAVLGIIIAVAAIVTKRRRMQARRNMAVEINLNGNSQNPYAQNPQYATNPQYQNPQNVQYK